MPDLLFEIGTEEIPASFIGPALLQLEQHFSQKASELQIPFATVRSLGTPRRLSLVVTDLAEKQNDIKEELLGPSKKAAFDGSGNHTKAAEGFARSKGVAVEDLQVVDTPKGEYLMLIREVAGQQTTSLLPQMLGQLLLELSFPKSMKWGSNQHSFARPIQWLTALFDQQVIPVSHEGLVAANTSKGHRFLDGKEFAVRHPSEYESQLLEKNVIADVAKRRQAVIDEIQKAVTTSQLLSHGRVAIDERLVDTVTNLVEQPHGVCGVFDEKFLQVPAEVLITSMREHQKYFPIVDDQGKLLPGFVAVNNTRVHDGEVTRKGHQRVLRARLEDALFFYNSDRETKLEKRVPDLGGIIFQAKLGTMAEKQERLVKLMRLLTEKFTPELVADGCRAALLCKTDLLTDMVGEFPSLQGTMGGAYARHDGENDNVARAIEEHYMPKRAGAELPPTELGALLGLADRIDTLAGCFGIGQIPTGTADPFGLRRISLAILHLLEERGYRLSLREVLHKALAMYGDKVAGGGDTVDKTLAFIERRFVNDCQRRGMNSGCVDAVVSVGFDDVTDCLQRIEALSAMSSKPEFSLLASAYKRIRNIIKDNTATDVDPDRLVETAEKDLFQLLGEVGTAVSELTKDRRYTEALQALLKMKEPIDMFFDEVMVMTEDQKLRQNRLNLLTAFGTLVVQVADISRLQEGA